MNGIKLNIMRRMMFFTKHKSEKRAIQEASQDPLHMREST